MKAAHPNRLTGPVDVSVGARTARWAGPRWGDGAASRLDRDAIAGWRISGQLIAS